MTTILVWLLISDYHESVVVAKFADAVECQRVAVIVKDLSYTGQKLFCVQARIIKEN